MEGRASRIKTSTEHRPHQHRNMRGPTPMPVASREGALSSAAASRFTLTTALHKDIKISLYVA